MKKEGDKLMTSLKTPMLYQFLDELYQEIRKLECENLLLAGQTDMRPNIDQYHDVISLKEVGVDNIEEISRLTHILHELREKPKGYVLSLPRLYEQYAVIYGTILSEMAEVHYQNEKGVIDEKITQLLAERSFLQEEAKRIMDDEDEDDTEILEKVDKNRKCLDAVYSEEFNLERVHTSFLSQVMDIYKDGKELVQKLANKGFNLAGDFTKKASAQAEERRRGGAKER